MKKLISLTLAIMLVLSLAVPALAADANTTTVTGKIGGDSGTETYTLVIPETASTGDFTNSSYATSEIKLSVANIKTTSKVKVSLTAATFDMTCESEKINCGVVFTTANAQSIELAGVSDSDTVTITPKAEDVAAASVGTYTGTITFSAELVSGD